MSFRIVKILPILLLASLILSATSTQAQGRKKKKKQKVSSVIKGAKAYIGTPYRYGGTTAKGIDCSGLMLQCFKKAGYTLPRTAKEQSKFGKKVGWSSIKPGDIVFFKFKQKGEKWWHSGVVTQNSKGNVKFIHASSSRGVVESNLLSDYYKKNVKSFRRVIK